MLSGIASKLEQEFDGLYGQLKAVAIPLLTEIEGERHGMVMPSDFDKLNAVMQGFANNASPRIRTVVERFLNEMRAAATEDAREDGHLMLDNDADPAAKPSARS